MSQIRIQNNIHILFFDGFCIFCNRLVYWIIFFDKSERIKFSSLQGKRAQKYLPIQDLKNIDSVIFYDGKNIYRKSEAIFKILSLLPWYFYPLMAFKFFPPSVLNYFYDLIAKKRYKLIKKQVLCINPRPNVKHRFLD